MVRVVTHGEGKYGRPIGDIYLGDLDIKSLTEVSDGNRSTTKWHG
jgi:hypothetical protein